MFHVIIWSMARYNTAKMYHNKNRSNVKDSNINIVITWGQRSYVISTKCWEYYIMIIYLLCVYIYIYFWSGEMCFNNGYISIFETSSGEYLLDSIWILYKYKMAYSENKEPDLILCYGLGVTNVKGIVTK